MLDGKVFGFVNVLVYIINVMFFGLKVISLFIGLIV